MAMLGGECSGCCGGGPCAGCNAPSWGSARRFAQSLASLNGTQYTGLSVDTGEVQDSVFTVLSTSGSGEFKGTTIFQAPPPLSGTVRGYAHASPDRSGCVYGAGEIIVPLGGYFLDSQGSRYRYYLSDDRYPPPPDDGSIVAAVPLFEFRVLFNRQQASLSPNITFYIPATWRGFWNQRTSRPIITSVRFGGESLTAPQWDGVRNPEINTAIFVSGAGILVPSSNCKWRDGAFGQSTRVLEVPDSNYRGPLEIDWAIFRWFIAGQDDNGDNIAGYALADSGTVTVQWDDMTEFEVDEDCNSGACCEVDGSCNIKPQCECDTENGAVFAGAGETCEACAPCGCDGLEGWPETIEVDVGISVGVVQTLNSAGMSQACEQTFRQIVEGWSGTYTLHHRPLEGQKNGLYYFREVTGEFLGECGGDFENPIQFGRYIEIELDQCWRLISNHISFYSGDGCTDAPWLGTVGVVQFAGQPIGLDTCTFLSGGSYSVSLSGSMGSCPWPSAKGSFNQVSTDILATVTMVPNPLP